MSANKSQNHKKTSKQSPRHKLCNERDQTRKPSFKRLSQIRSNEFDTKIPKCTQLILLCQLFGPESFDSKVHQFRVVVNIILLCAGLSEILKKLIKAQSATVTVKKDAVPIAANVNHIDNCTIDSANLDKNIHPNGYGHH